MKTNPYTLIFGKEPSQLLSRYPDTYNIIDDFESENSNHIFMLTGVRGSGKTVMMTTISKHFSKEDDWIVIDLTPDINLIQSFNAELGESKKLKQHFKAEGISISLPGLQVNIEKNEPVTDERMAAIRMLELAAKKNLKVLVTIDETISNKSVRTFASLFQIFLRKDLPVYLIMTGLHENINILQNEETLTFLYRAPKVEMKPLSISNISKNYQKTFSIDADTAKTMARLTKGYPFAFQVLGFFTWNEKGDYLKILDEYKQYLGDYVYEKIWLSLSPKDRQITAAIASSEKRNTAEIKELLGLKQNEFSPYRKRLIDKGIITSTGHGSFEFTLPFFDE